MQTLLHFFPKGGEGGKMATVPKGRLRKFTSARTRQLLRRAVKVAVLTLVVVLCFRWNQRRRFALGMAAREERMLNVERQVEGIKVLEMTRIEDEDPMSVYDQVLDPVGVGLRREFRAADSNKAPSENKFVPAPGEPPISEGQAGGDAPPLDEKSRGEEERTDSENKIVSDGVWDDVGQTRIADKKEVKEESDNVARESDTLDKTKEGNIAPNTISEKVEEENVKKIALNDEGKNSTTKSAESPPQESQRNASSTATDLRRIEKDPSAARETSKNPANESLAVDAIEGTIGKLKDAIGGIKMKLDDMKPSANMHYRGYENHPPASAMEVLRSPSTVKEPAAGLGVLAGRYAGAKDQLVFGLRESAKEEQGITQHDQKPVDLQQRLSSPWGWACINGRCVKQEKSDARTLSSLDTCKLTCGPHGSLWPRPTGVTRIGDTTVSFLLKNLSLESIKAHGDGESMLLKAFDIFMINLVKEHGHFESANQVLPEALQRKVKVSIVVSGADTGLSLETPEAYTLDVVTQELVTKVNIFALSFFGARHGLETLLQLIAFDEDDGALHTLMLVSDATVEDSPAFKYRGILLDTSRNFFSVKSIERTLDAMAANKLNTFHWHITDTQSFPLHLETLPNMAYYGAYSPRQVYYPADVRHLVEYGRIRGIRVLPEFDAPAHVGNGWQWTEKQGLGKLAICLNKEPWHSYCAEPPCGQLNVANNNTYTILSQIYKEVVPLFGPLDLFHFGGDEVNLKCWNTTEEIVRHMEEQGRGRSADSYYKLWSDFQAKAHGLLTEANLGKPIPGILWTSELTLNRRAAEYLDRNHNIIQIWTTKEDAVIRELLESNFRVIFSNYDHWYLDCGFGGWVNQGNNWCSPFKGWQTVYDNSPLDIAVKLTGSSHSELILGGEAALWGEQVDDMTLDSRLWPRGAALAERLWTNPSHNWAPAATRFVHHRQRMVSRGIRADRVQPEWCHQNEGHCY
ncbi:chitooligosaccharidolytic beta-N-acetylglucosaminidase-like [Penaeus japonicus]|uniref:chitooligosaccharidolytic beta-N-acetylglucosaminidase-like n=1 Tax=Penaeus japonicus TaxID=27405 RepID=UPI001C70BC23|nr:chitooligosaccharidolytic beta-N-acetylglucosaminidase-like [Penaeus japonicus]